MWLKIVSLFDSLPHLFCFIVSLGILPDSMYDYRSPFYGTQGGLQSSPKLETEEPMF